MGLCSNLALAIVTLIFLKDSHWTSVDPIIYGAAIFIIMISRITTDNSEIGERIFYVIFLITVCAASRVFFFSKYLKWVSWLPERFKDIDEEIFDSSENFADISEMHDDHYRAFGEAFVDNVCPVVEDPTALSPTEYREMDDWYLKMRSASAPKDAFKKFVHALAVDVSSEQGRALLHNMTHDFLCYPTSRINGPRPSKYLHSLKTPRLRARKTKRETVPWILSLKSWWLS